MSDMKGPVTLADWFICPVCHDFIAPGEHVFLVEDEGLDDFMQDDYVHIGCAAQYEEDSTYAD